MSCSALATVPRARPYFIFLVLTLLQTCCWSFSHVRIGSAASRIKHHAITVLPLRPRSEGSPGRFAERRRCNRLRRTALCASSGEDSAEESGAGASQSRGDAKRARQKNTIASKGFAVEEERSWRKPMTYTIFRRSHDKEIMAMAVPSYMAVLLDPIATLIDISFIGRLPEAGLSLAGVGIGNAITNYFGDSLPPFAPTFPPLPLTPALHSNRPCLFSLASSSETGTVLQ
eukprot:3713974-Rhodomonas_salina.4